MIQLLSEDPISIVRFRAEPWPFQQTFHAPLKELEKFVETLLHEFELRSCSISTDQVVFDPDDILSLFNQHSITVENQWSFVVTAEGRNHVKELLVATLSDWIDFCFVPEPESFAIYADHHEYCTFYARDESAIRQIKSSLLNAGFRAVDDYARRSSDGIWR